MVLCVKVPKKIAQEVKKYMLARNLFLQEFLNQKTAEHIYFPTKKRFTLDEQKAGEITFEERELSSKNKMPSYRDAAKDLLGDELYALGRFAYDTVGTIAILEITEPLLPREVELAQLLLGTNKHIHTVLKKKAGHEGTLRKQEMIYLAGENTKETIVYESSIRLVINVEEVYYSIRLGTERNRIMKLVKPGEHILCMFSGAAPYPIVFARNTSAEKIVGIELNKKGHELGLQNITLNHIANIELICGDVAIETPKLVAHGQKFSRITMPLPHTGEDFFIHALQAIRPNGTIHYYCFIDKDDVEQKKNYLTKLAQQSGKRIEHIDAILCGQHSPNKFRACFDITVA